jgi:hypothetical protein
MASSKRVTISLPGKIADDLDFISARLGVSRSAFLSQLLTEANLGDLRSLVSTLPESPSEGDTRRFRGESRQFVKSRIDQLHTMQGGLFDDTTE